MWNFAFGKAWKKLDFKGFSITILQSVGFSARYFQDDVTKYNVVQQNILPMVYDPSINESTHKIFQHCVRVHGIADQGSWSYRSQNSSNFSSLGLKWQTNQMGAKNVWATSTGSGGPFRRMIHAIPGLTENIVIQGFQGFISSTFWLQDKYIIHS